MMSVRLGGGEVCELACSHDERYVGGGGGGLFEKCTSGVDKHYKIRFQEETVVGN